MEECSRRSCITMGGMPAFNPSVVLLLALGGSGQALVTGRQVKYVKYVKWRAYTSHDGTGEGGGVSGAENYWSVQPVNRAGASHRGAQRVRLSAVHPISPPP